MEFKDMILKEIIIKNLVKDSKKSFAERKGFEPSMRFPAYTLSRRAPSTTRTPLFNINLFGSKCFEIYKLSHKIIDNF